MNTQTVPSRINANTSDHFDPEPLSPAWFRDPKAVRMLVEVMEAEQRAGGAKPIRTAYREADVKYHWQGATQCCHVVNPKMRVGIMDRLLSDVRVVQMEATARHRICGHCWREFQGTERPAPVAKEKKPPFRIRLDGPPKDVYEHPVNWTPEERKKLKGLRTTGGGRGYRRGTLGAMSDGERN